ncbi:hypothetical protein M758_9G049700 [Ceratodon purpureus]|nr:hypothetical protein M758_9G049700 [Ceratodon purpureus]
MPLEMSLGNDPKDYIQLASNLLIVAALYNWWKRIYKERNDEIPRPSPHNSPPRNSPPRTSPPRSGCPCGLPPAKRYE